MRAPAPKQPKPPKPALPVPKQLKVQHQENEALSRFFLEKWRAMMQEPDGLSENNYLTIAKANRSLCAAKEPIRTLRDFSKIKGVGQWLLRHMEGFFADSSQDLSSVKGKKTRGPKRYLPGKNTAAYAILITLHRAKIKGKEFMMKQELIDAAEASGLSRDAIGPNKSKAKQSFGKDWYTGWSCMKTLMSKGLVIKRHNPAEYLLTGEGESTARDCLSRSGLDDSAGPLMITNAHNASAASQVQTTNICRFRDNVTRKNNFSCLNSFCRRAIPIPDQKISNLITVMKKSFAAIQIQKNLIEKTFFSMARDQLQIVDSQIIQFLFLLYHPKEYLRGNFLVQWSRSRKVADNIRSQIHVPVEIRKLPVGDGIWIARHRKDHTEYVLDFIVERKEVLDLDGSIADNRYRDQKLRLKRCGLRKLIYLVEGDPNHPDAPERIKTACFTTEILDGFDVQRTSGFADTQRRYCYLTLSIIKYYDANFSIYAKTSRVCPTYDEFKRKCCDLEKTTVSEIFALQLMQVPQVTEEAALAVIELYPTPFFLAQAYSTLDGDTHAQEEMLKNKSKKVNGGASRNIFELFCGDGRNIRN
ncbi:crossover junction endonuclease MUS81-like isoform X3 [Panicum virgatum]|uniref:crossover junction endonuclease MUS81-like isoform X3 n=1 Tax=Panicum virgatum TaxID=38727 RepID=UPI0019D50EF6|nr:crossover junction endonuclease MUS81-like isoform X3 [Panicum virgatum]